MFNIDMYPDVLLHLRGMSQRFHKHSSGWIEIFCPYCDDATRKFNPGHGHFHVAPNYPFGHCFRCGAQVGLDKLLRDTGFTNNEILEKLRRTSGFTYGKDKKIKSEKRFSLTQLRSNIDHEYTKFYDTYPYRFNEFKSYIQKRCFEIDPTKFFLLPAVENETTGVRFLNHDGNLVTTRLINSEQRYMNPNVRRPYYFQDLENIDEYKSIVITEGAFDLINLYNFSSHFDKDSSFFISIGGNQYKGVTTELISNYLMIGKYNVNVVFDQGLKNLDRLIKLTKLTANILNPDINLKFFLPSAAKDVSDCILLKQL